MNLATLGASIRHRREALGLTQTRLAHLSELSRQTLVGLENGSLSDLGFQRVARVLAVLGLDLDEPSTQARDRKRGLWMAAKTASVSYAPEFPPAVLAEALAQGEVPPRYAAHLAYLLDEAPVPIVVMAVEEAAALQQVSPRSIWAQVGRLAEALDVHKRALWS